MKCGPSFPGLVEDGTPLHGASTGSLRMIRVRGSRMAGFIGVGGKIKIKGVISAGAGSQLNFSARLGMWQEGRFIVIKEASHEVQVIQPLLFISQQINGLSNYAASLGETLNYEVFFRNIGSTSFDNLFEVNFCVLCKYFLTFDSISAINVPNINVISCATALYV